MIPDLQAQSSPQQKMQVQLRPIIPLKKTTTAQKESFRFFYAKKCPLFLGLKRVLGI
jgi:hypothetical protein